MKQYIPHNLDLKKLLDKHPPQFNFVYDKFVRILHLVSELPAYDLGVDFTPLNSQKLQKGCIKDYKKYLDYLVEHQVLETDGSYIVGERSRGYRFTSTYNTFLKPVKLSHRPLLKNLRRVHAPKKTKYPFLQRWFNSKLTIDVDAALKYLWKKRDHDLQTKVNSPYSRLNKAKCPYRKLFAACILVRKLNDGEYYFVVDSTAGRLHTNLTSLPSALRNFLSYDDLPLVNVDFKNSQPLMSTIILDQNFYTSTFPDQCSISSNINYNNSTSTSSITTSLLPPTIMLDELEQCLDNKDIETFIEKTQKGVLYEYIREEYMARTDKVLTRDEVKKMIFITLFSDNRFIGQPDAELKRMFKEIFPNVYQKYALIKKKDKTVLPRLLQSIESSLVLDKIATRIAHERPKLPIYTIHDSIATLKGEEDYVKEVMTEETEKNIGVSPTLSTDYWSCDNVKWDNLKLEDES